MLHSHQFADWFLSNTFNWLASLLFQKLVEELGIYFLTYDRAGYGESDPDPKHSVKSEAFDIQELADQLELGARFYVIGISMGSYAAWSCLKHIPHRYDTTLFFIHCLFQALEWNSEVAEWFLHVTF